MVWNALWIFEFPGGYFAPGNHTLEGMWSIVEYPFRCVPCPDRARAEVEAEGGWDITATTVGMIPSNQQAITLTVLYPP